MRRLLLFLPFQFAVFLILGIVVQFYFQIWQFDFKLILLTHLLFCIIIFFLHSKKIATLLSFCYFFFVGLSLVFVDNKENHPNYFEHYLHQNSSAILKVDKVLKSTTYYDKYIAEVIQIDYHKTVGTILLNLNKDSLSSSLRVDELLLSKPVFQEVHTTLNPHQFDYKQYLEKQGIRKELILNKHNIRLLGMGSRTLKGYSDEFRNFVEISLKKCNFKKDELAVINALLLGQKQDLSKQIIKNYSRAGAIHILAVSGLHVGIILLLLMKLTNPIQYLRNGKIIQLVCVILILWMYAFIAGLSASIVRAVSMFTFLAIGQEFGSKRMILFSLFASMFFLLLFNPLFIFDVGFQLSYLAVLSIITIQKKLHKLFEPKYYLTNKIWQLTTVSLAAQIGVLPLSLYYFHQFPGLFFLSNILIIPFLGLVLILGILLIFLAIFQIVPPFFSNAYGGIIALINKFVAWISQQESFLLQDVSMSLGLLLASYGLIFFGFRFFIHKTPKKLVFFLISIVMLQSVIVFERVHGFQKSEFIVFNKIKKTILGFRKNNTIKIIHNIDNLQNIHSIVKAYKINENVIQDFEKLDSNIYYYHSNPILIIDSLGVYEVQNLSSPMIILQNSPKINLERMIRKLHPNQIIADGSNYKTFVSVWENTARKLKTPFHSTAKNGAFIMN